MGARAMYFKHIYPYAMLYSPFWSVLCFPGLYFHAIHLYVHFCIYINLGTTNEKTFNICLSETGLMCIICLSPAVFNFCKWYGFILYDWKLFFVCVHVLWIPHFLLIHFSIDGYLGCINSLATVSCASAKILCKCLCDTLNWSCSCQHSGVIYLVHTISLLLVCWGTSILISILSVSFIFDHSAEFHTETPTELKLYKCWGNLFSLETQF